MGSYGQDFTHDNATELTGYGLKAVYFQTGHGDLMHQCLCVVRRIDPLSEPLLTEFHGICLVLELFAD
jgi:hypothetical protein